jgi:3-oxoacyl-[acyl-carrier protein] reductase
MSDLLLNIAQKPSARRIIKRLRLPIPLPQKIRRADGPWLERPLSDQRLLLAPSSPALGEHLARILASAGANVVSQESAGDERVHGVVLDVTDLRGPAGLRVLYDELQPWMRRIHPCGRLTVLGRPVSEAATATEAATRAALVGFVKSCSRELGRTGSTAQLITVSEGAEDRVGPTLRYLLSDRSSFVSGQVYAIDALAQGSDLTSWTRPLEGKTALVTGGARGIGEAICRRFAREGAFVLVVDRPQAEAEGTAVAESIHGAFMGVDVSCETAVDTLDSSLRELYGGVDIVVHNAGITRDKTLAKMSPEAWDQTVAVNLSAITGITDRLVDGALRDGGRIIALSSIAGIAGNAGQTNYAATKAGVIGYVEALAPQVAQRGITVNAIAPGFIETQMTAAIPPMIREASRRMSALSQGGEPRDVAELALFLASPGAVGLTGGVFRICGGHIAGA